MAKRDRSLSPVNLGVLAVAGPAPKKVKGVEVEGQETEKRLALFKKACPKNITERVDRVLTQRFFCVSRARTSEISEEFKILGSAGNVYDISIGRLPSCTCPDGKKGNHCKHILFVLLKILQLPLDCNLYYQKALLTQELVSIFSYARKSPVDAATKRVANVYKKATGQEVEDDIVNKKLPVLGDSCPICYEDLPPNSEKGLVFCEVGCGNALHSVCAQAWSKQTSPNITCVFCRAIWPESSFSNAVAGPSYSEGYLNLAGAAGISNQRDTSTYYNGPRKGVPYKGGYGSYGGRY